MDKYFRYSLSMALTLALAVPIFAQQRSSRASENSASSDEVLMLEEIKIEVAPELPTVIVSIPRQTPDLKSVALEKDAEDLITAGAQSVKPRLADLRINELEAAEKMLAKDRAQ